MPKSDDAEPDYAEPDDAEEYQEAQANPMLDKPSQAEGDAGDSDAPGDVPDSDESGV